MPAVISYTTHSYGKCLLYAAIVVARGFTMSQSAAAHHILFKHIFSIVELDTGHPLQFCHIHGSGWDTVIADEHRGQALGLFTQFYSADGSLSSLLNRFRPGIGGDL